MSNKSDAARWKQAERDRRKAAGLVEYRKYIKPEWKTKLDEFVKQLEESEK
jgi:hypothetical protein